MDGGCLGNLGNRVRNGCVDLVEGRGGITSSKMEGAAEGRWV